MSGRLQPKQSRPWERGSPGRRRPGAERGAAANNDRRDPGSPDRSKRGRWEFPSRGRMESPPRNRMDSPPRNRMDSPVRMRRRDFDLSPRAGRRDGFSPSKPRRSGFDDGFRSSFGERHRAEEEHGILGGDHPDGGQGPPAGLVFLCSSVTLRECFHYRVLGLPAAQREVVERVVPGTKLFLFHFDKKELFGVFEAASRGGLDLVPQAFLDSKAAYASQVRFNILRECPPLPDEVVRDVLSQNFSERGKFNCELTADQVEKLMQLFLHRPGLPVQEREMHALGDHGLERDGGHVPPLPGPFPHESQLLLDRSLGEGLNPDPAVILGMGMIEEVDQLARKYLHNHPGLAGVHLDPINTSLLSTTFRRNFPMSSMEHSVAHGGNIGAVNVNGPLAGIPFSATGGGMRNPRFGSSAHGAGNMERLEHSSNDGGRLSGQFLPSSTPSDRGLLPIPGLPPPGIPNQSAFHLQHSITNQPGMGHSFPGGGAIQGPFPMAAGPMMGVRPELGGPFVPPLHPLQGPLGLPSHAANPPQPVASSAGANHVDNRQQVTPQKGGNNKNKKRGLKKKFKQQKGVGNDKDAKKDEGEAGADPADI